MTCEDNRFCRLLKNLRCACNLCGPWHAVRFIRSGKRAQAGEARDRLYVLRNTKIDGARPRSLGFLERFPHHLRYGSGVDNHLGPFCNRLEHTQQIDNLMRLLMDTVEADLGTDRYQRSAIGEGVGGSQKQINRARSQRGYTDTRLARNAAIDVSHE
ncbi:hypothetical protein MSSAC_2209 [Methanosarcina siciliae C2J]|uniref:Uncharacterized protein n=1 Tax=Methanosarcina siciliae C2J TaxID=1434118 RepID=A0A0E3PNN9_9EURY|nr:hypothetical protein MSSAC_2209 [Methanosarcina siciliae C2J]